MSLSSRCYRDNCYSDGSFRAQVVQQLSKGQSHSTIAQTMSIPMAFQEFFDVFQKHTSVSLPPYRDLDCEIPTIPGAIIPYSRIYSLSLYKKQVMREYLDENLRFGLIVWSASPAGAPLFFLPKMFKELRHCIDYCGLNRVTERTLTRFHSPKKFLSLFMVLNNSLN